MSTVARTLPYGIRSRSSAKVKTSLQSRASRWLSVLGR